VRARPGASQIDAGGRCPRLRAPAEQISQEVAVVPELCAVDLPVAAVERVRVAVRFDCPALEA